MKILIIFNKLAYDTPKKFKKAENCKDSKRWIDSIDLIVRLLPVHHCQRANKQWVVSGYTQLKKDQIV